MDLDHNQVTQIIAFIVAVGPFFAAFGALVGSWYATRTSAKQSELVQLRDRVDELSRENIDLHKTNIVLRQYIFDLRVILAKHGIKAPELLEIEDYASKDGPPNTVVT